MVEPDGVDGRHKAGHDGGGSPSTVVAMSTRLFLDRIRNCRYTFDIAGIDTLGRRPGAERPRLFETLQTTTTARARRRTRISYLNRP
jgi:hypothetical protein